MKNIFDLNMINDKILKTKKLLIELETMTKEFPAIAKNSNRALASVKMMELNISDVVAFDLEDDPPAQ